MSQKPIFLIFILLVSAIGCTNKTAVPSTQSAPLPSQVGTTQTTPSDLTYNTSSVSTSNLWDTTLTNDLIPSPSPVPTPIPVLNQNILYPAQLNCLNGGIGGSYPQTVPTNSINPNGTIPPLYASPTGTTTTMPSACFDSAWGGLFGQDELFTAGLESFGAMQGCYQLVMSRAPQFCTSGYDATEVFQMSKMALVRCFRNILRQQVQLTQWAAPQLQTFEQNDQNLFLLLQLFSQGENAI